MATYYSDQFPSGNHPDTRDVGKANSGELRQAKVSYTMVGTEAAAEQVYLFKLPAGSEIIPDASHTESVGTVAVTATLDVGDDDGSGDGDRYVDGADVAAAGVDAFSLRPNYVLTENANIIATFATLSTPNEGGVIWFYITYRMA